MKIAITGHTSGLGLALYDHFSLNHEVIGLSRSNGYDIAGDKDKIADVVNGCDVFFNNAHSSIHQAKLIANLYNSVSIITSGSIGADYSHLNNQYYKDKRFIENIHKTFSKKRIFPILLLKMGYLENYKNKNKHTITYQEVINAVEFWLLNPKVTLIEFDNLTL